MKRSKKERLRIVRSVPPLTHSEAKALAAATPVGQTGSDSFLDWIANADDTVVVYGECVFFDRIIAQLTQRRSRVQVVYGGVWFSDASAA